MKKNRISNVATSGDIRRIERLVNSRRNMLIASRMFKRGDGIAKIADRFGVEVGLVKAMVKSKILHTIASGGDILPVVSLKKLRHA